MPLPFPMAAISNFLFPLSPYPTTWRSANDRSFYFRTNRNIRCLFFQLPALIWTGFLCLVSHSRLFPFSAGVLRSLLMVRLCSDVVYPPAAALLRTVFSAPSLLPLPQQTYTHAQLSPRLFTFPGALLATEMKDSAFHHWTNLFFYNPYLTKCFKGVSHHWPNFLFLKSPFSLTSMHSVFLDSLLNFVSLLLLTLFPLLNF